MSARSYILWLVLGFGFLGVAFIYSASKSAEVMGEFLSVGDWTNKESDLDNADVALISLEGIILDSSKWIKRLKKIEKSSVPAVVIRIDSPGGAVGPSQEMYGAVMKLRKKKKVYCSFGDLAASGGYYVGAACEKIFTNSGTITGSIGVIMSMMNLKDLYAWAKVKPVTIKAGKFKDVGSSSRDMLPEEKQLLQDMIDEVHSQFKSDIKAGRPNLSDEAMALYADGRVFSGNSAVKYGFADAIGSQADVMDTLKEELGIDRELKIADTNNKGSRIERFLEENYSGNSLSSSIMGAVQKLSPEFHPKLEAGRAYLLPYFWFDQPSAR